MQLLHDQSKYSFRTAKGLRIWVANYCRIAGVNITLTPHNYQTTYETSCIVANVQVAPKLDLTNGSQK